MPRFSLPDKFDDGDIAVFKKAFERVAKANSWDDAQQLAALPLALTGRALSAFERGEADFKAVDEAFTYLEAEFNKALDKESAMKEFNACQWGEGLDPAVFADRLKGLLRRGLPSLNDDDVERMVTAQFISGFPSVHREKLILLFAGKAPTLPDVIAAARDLVRDPFSSTQACAVSVDSTIAVPEHDDSRFEKLESKLEELVAHVAALSAREPEMRGGHRITTTMVRGKGPGFRDRGRSNQGSSIQCFNCSGYGHIARVCPSPPMNSKAGNGKPEDRRPTTNPRSGANWSA